MCKKSHQDLVEQIHNMLALREEVLMRTFDELEATEPTLAKLLLEEQRDRSRAAHWAALPHRNFSSRSVYQVLADGDIDLLWDHLLGDQDQQAPTPAVPHSESQYTGSFRAKAH